MNQIKAYMAHHKKRIALIAAFFFLILLGRALYQILFPPKTAKTIPYVRTITVGTDETSGTYTYPGTVRGKYESVLSFQVNGRITKRLVNLGDTVKAGDVLMTIDPKDVREQVRNAEAAVNAAASRAKLARDNASRYEALYEEGAVSASLWDQYRTEEEAASAALSQASASLQTAQNQLSYTELTADHDGVVAALSGEVGQVATAGSPMATVIQDGQREVEIFVPESRLASIAPGTPVTVTCWALHNEEAAGTVRYISPMADPATKTYKVRVSLTEMPQGAQLGMTAKVALMKKGTAALMVPRSALYEAAGKTGIWVVTDGRVFLHPVTLGSYEDDTVTITDGLTEGDCIVTGGISKLKEGMEVKVEGSDT